MNNAAIPMASKMIAVLSFITLLLVLSLCSAHPVLPALSIYHLCPPLQVGYLPVYGNFLLGRGVGNTRLRMPELVTADETTSLSTL